MMTTNLFVIANVKQLRTDGSFRILLPFFSKILGHCTETFLELKYLWFIRNSADNLIISSPSVHNL